MKGEVIVNGRSAILACREQAIRYECSLSSAFISVVNFIETPINGLYEIDVRVFEDERGWFARTFCDKAFSAIGHSAAWTQLNHSFTKHQGAIRGLHYQVAPFSEVKMVKCIAGKVFDVAIDLRKGSDTFLQWHGIEISAENRKMLYIPAGFAHGFQAMSENCELLYHHTSYYEPEFERGIRYDDPTLAIRWPLQAGTMSDRDMAFVYVDASIEGI